MQEEVFVQEEAPERGADEIYCPSCGSAIGRGLAVCPQCGKGIPFELQGVAEGNAQRFRQPMRQPVGQRATSTPQGDVAGAGRYVINFLLAGIIGLGLTYFLRNEGWLATWISIPIAIIVAVLLFQTGALDSGTTP